MTQVQVGKNALQKLSLEYRSAASRLMRSNSDSGDANLARFMDFIDRNPMIRNFVEQELQSAEIGEDFKLDRDDSGRWVFPLSPSGEFACVYRLFQAALKNEHGHDYASIAWGYDSSSGNQDRNIEAFQRDVFLPFAQHIENHITGLLRDAADSDDKKTSVTVSDGSIYVAGDLQGSNVAAKAATISDSTAAHNDNRSLAEEVAELRDFLDDVPAEQRGEAEEAIEVLIKSASGEEIAKPVLAGKVDLLTRLSPQMKDHLANLLVNAGGSLAAHFVIQAIMFVLGKPA